VDNVGFVIYTLVKAGITYIFCRSMVFNFGGDKLTSKLRKIAYFFWVVIAHKGMLFIARKSKDFSNGI